MGTLRQTAMMHVGRPVVVHTHTGVHYGILHHCDDRGMYLLQNRRAGLVSGAASSQVQLLQEGDASADVEAVFWPLFFIPWLAAAAIAPWWWGPYW